MKLEYQKKKSFNRHRKKTFEGKSNYHKNLPVVIDNKGLLRVILRLVLSNDIGDLKDSIYPTV